MGTYVYTAKRDRSSPFNGELVGDSKAAVVSELRRKGFTVLRLEEKKGAFSFDIGKSLSNRQRIKARDKAILARQFATMISSGLAVLRALMVLEEQTENARLRKIVHLVREDVEAGMPLSDSMAKHPAAFDRLYVSMVRAGEAGGALDQTLNRLATQLEKDDSLKRSIRSAMAYPMLIACFALLVLIGMLLFIIPGIIAAYRYAMTFYILADHPGMDALAAIRRSKEMMRGNKLKLFCLGWRFFWWFLLCIPTCFIGLIWLVPYMNTSLAKFYDDLKPAT